MINLNLLLPYEKESLQAIPKDYDLYQWKAAPGVMINFPLGEAIINYFETKEFTVWICYYLPSKSGSFTRQSEAGLIEFLVPFHNAYSIKKNWLHEIILKENQFNLYYLPRLQHQVEMTGGIVYSTFAIHFEKAFLEQFVPENKLWEVFLQNMNEQQPAGLLSRPLYLSPSMIMVMNEMLRCDFPRQFTAHYFQLKVKELLILLFRRMTTAAVTATVFSTKDIQKAEEVKQIIFSDFEKFHTIKELSRLVGTNEHKLKATFRHVFGTSIFTYSRQARLDYARQLLIETDWTLQHIAMAVGYPEASNFSLAFKQYYGYAPGYLKKKTG